MFEFRRALGVAALAAGTLLAINTVNAADHGDSPSAGMDPSVDIADLYAWMSTDASMVNLIMTFPSTMFSDASLYVFHTVSNDGMGNNVQVDVICSFDANQTVSCWVGDQDYVTGDASDPAGITSDSGMVRVFAGQRDDPFYFNISGFINTVNAVQMAAGGLMFDGAGCPALDMMTSTALVGLLSTGQDGFAGMNVASLVLQIDKTLLNTGGDTIAVYGATYGQ